MAATTYTERRSEIEHYFDRTAADAWSKLTSDAPVSKIRATVRAGRDQMRQNLLGWLPADLTGKRLLDAGCGTGALSVEAAARGAEVVAIDLSPTLVDLARERMPDFDNGGSITFCSGDMLDPSLGEFDHVAAMDSIIHYSSNDALHALTALAERTSGSIVFTYAPQTPLLSVMLAVGRLFPKKDRAPWIEPMAASKVHKHFEETTGLEQWSVGRTERVASGFYKSQALELVKR